jgi:hypothetical protein
MHRSYNIILIIGYIVSNILPGHAIAYELDDIHLGACIVLYYFSETRLLVVPSQQRRIMERIYVGS